ncbi:solute carrier family 25 member 16-like [Mya arenaria]|uniref:solute carrier family 25 member 16-like n=1 Tax=Mya arenaria TaxID=6604 RepID=UPI0022E22485|nr:solute carrier family 25 member 16-like [Mya arenaria]XP_052780737.1 solute carrier family 25 member 16-like [Mya arenaria]
MVAVEGHIKKRNTEKTLKTLLAGGIAGCCAKSAVAPLDRVKILMQGHNKYYRHSGVFKSLNSVYQKEGVVGLYKGNYFQMIRVLPYSAVTFTSYDIYKSYLQNFTHHVHPNLVHLCAGSLAGMTAVILTYPLDVMRARIAFQLKGHHIYHGGMIETVKTISRQEGFMALYRGLFTSLLGMAPYGGLSFWAFERSKLFVLANFPGMFGSPHAENMDGLSLSVPAKLICGAFAGAVAQTVVYPLDVARRKLQLSTMLCEPHKYDGKSIWQILVTVRNDHGVVKGLFRGITVNYWRGVPSSAISFTMFEMMKQLLGLDTGVTR